MVVQIPSWLKRCGDTVGSCGGIVGRSGRVWEGDAQMGDKFVTKGSQCLLFSFPKS